MDELLGRLKFLPRLLAHKNATLGRPFEQADLEDLVQDVLIAVWKKLGSFEGRCPLEPWIYRFAHLEMLHRLRVKSRLPTLIADIGVNKPQQSDFARETNALESETLYRLLDQLDSADADVIRLRHLEELTFKEIGERLRISDNTAKTRYYRGLKKARSIVRGLEGDSLAGGHP